MRTTLVVFTNIYIINLLYSQETRYIETMLFFNVGPASKTMAQHENNIVSMYRFCWVDHF